MAGSAGMTGAGFTCPTGPFTAPALSGAKATKAAAPPSDAFNKDQFTVVEGPVWIGDSLYVSELIGGNMIPLARILKLAPDQTVSIVTADSGSNGLAVDASGQLFAAVHKDGSISQVALPGGMETAIVHTYGTAPRFNSPNDLAIRSDGTIYFSDPIFQNNSNPQMAERLYRLTPGPTRTVSIATNPSDMAYLSPNGVTLSPDEHTLYVSGSGLKKFAVMADGTLGVSSDFVTGGSPGSALDGMAMDCAGDLYVAGNNSSSVSVYSPAGALLGSVTTDGGVSTNVAFGGADHKTLYITAMGTEGQRGIYSLKLSVPGFPY
jgi:gluconolactonase